MDSHRAVMEQRPNGKVSITNKLTYAFQAGDHGKLLRCVTTGPWLNMDDAHEAFAGLNVICEFLLSLFFCCYCSGCLTVTYPSQSRRSPKMR